MVASFESILRFWFGDLTDDSQVPPQSKIWFTGGEAVDKYWREHFSETLEAASRGQCDGWLKSPEGTLALIILLDQGSRHIHRGTPRAFSQDSQALELAKALIGWGQDKTLNWFERIFAYLPFEHTEDRECQEKSVKLVRELVQSVPDSLREFFLFSLRYSERHREIIQRFGRFPHRNSILGRASTPAELEFLKEPLSSF